MALKLMMRCLGSKYAAGLLGVRLLCGAAFSRLIAVHFSHSSDHDGGDPVSNCALRETPRLLWWISPYEEAVEKTVLIQLSKKKSPDSVY